MRTIAFLIFPGFQLLDTAGPIAAFEMASREVEGAYRLVVIAADPGAVESSAGATMIAAGFEDAGPLDTLLVTGGQGTARAAQCPRTVGFVREAASTARRTGSVCSGAYVLAAAGLLDGRRATTHWGQGARLARLFPNVAVESDRIFIRQDNLWTSAGVTAGIDMALAMIAEDLGDAVARRVAQELVVFHRRPGGQSQFSALLDLEQPEGKLAGVMSWARTRLAEALPVERLAEEAGMSPRNFARVFTAQMGVTPAKAVERLRLEAAREAVETGGEPIDVIARITGFADPERMRRAFIRNFGQPPQALRRTARRQIAS
jgi:transcriptional regulator GlxA family with amidase domain